MIYWYWSPRTHRTGHDTCGRYRSPRSCRSFGPYLSTNTLSWLETLFLFSGQWLKRGVLYLVIYIPYVCIHMYNGIMIVGRESQILGEVTRGNFYFRPLFITACLSWQTGAKRRPYLALPDPLPSSSTLPYPTLPSSRNGRYLDLITYTHNYAITVFSITFPYEITSKPGMIRIIPGIKKEGVTIRTWCVKTRAQPDAPGTCCCAAVSAYRTFCSIYGNLAGFPLKTKAFFFVVDRERRKLHHIYKSLAFPLSYRCLHLQ